jgi:hypothetical protein
MKGWSEDMKGADAMTVNQGLDLAGRVENGGNLKKLKRSS